MVRRMSNMTQKADSPDLLNLDVEYDKVLDQTAGWLDTAMKEGYVWLTSIDTYTQASIIAVCVTVAYMAGWLIRRRIPFFRQQKEACRKGTGRWLLARTGRLISPVLALIFLTLASYGMQHWKQPVELLGAAERVSWVWLLWVLLKAYVTHPLVRTTALWILLPAAVLRLFGLLLPVTEYLDSIGFSVGEVDITVYKVLKGLLVASVLIWLGKVLSSAGESYIRMRKHLNISTRELLVKLFQIALYFLLFVMLLDMIGIDLTALAVFSGALGVGLGFGLQKIASNFISGIILLTERSITIGNLLEMDDGLYGFMRRMGARSSVIETFDGKEVVVPNEDFITSRVANLTQSNRTGRIEVAVGVSYASDLKQVEGILLEAAKGHPECMEDPEPKVYLREFGDSSVNFLMTFWVGDVEITGKWGPQSDVMHTIWDRFHEEGIEIPFPQQDVHIKGPIDLRGDKDGDDK